MTKKLIYGINKDTPYTQEEAREMHALLLSIRPLFAQSCFPISCKNGIGLANRQRSA
jgi:hypothetical protein